MINLLKAGCIALYLLALASLVVVFPNGAGPVIQTLALAFLAVHVLEMLIAFKHIKSYPGPLSTSIVLALLFGLLHWMPLAKANQQANRPASNA
jgi:uncharacterized protein YhhL (DUF1145 family)